ncbi:hypothetical protein A2U01_0082421, partial [Trifolium medium]|nr:hypothetical protein [Trifolium medium]
MTDCERESEAVGDEEELFGDKGERFQTVIVVNEETDDTFPTFK